MNQHQDNEELQIFLPPPPPKKTGDKVVDKIQKMEQDRQERRQQMEEKKIQKQQKEEYNKLMGKNVDVDFEMMIDKQRFKEDKFQEHTYAKDVKLCVCVRKRPIFKKEEQNGEIDSISCANPSIRIHAPKYKVDGITRIVENYDFTFDNAFNENENSDDIYAYSLKPIIELLVKGGVVTCFAYGQTGSGKTFTMKGLQDHLVNDIFKLMEGKNLTSYVTFFEIYGGRCYDCLNNKNHLVILEDKNNNVQIQGLLEKQVDSAQEMCEQIEYGHSIRTTHSTASNDTSSRSHAICSIIIKDKNNKECGKLTLVDLAGSERAADCQSNNRQRRIEGAEINKSLLALKECIRAMDQGASHIPFRASKLTLVIRDSFLSKGNLSKIIMIACISPGSSSTDHSVNTLRYADRLKENKPVITRQGSKLDQQQENRPEELQQLPQQPKVQKVEEVRQKPPIQQIQANENNSQQQQQFHRKESPQQGQDFHKKDSPSNQQQQLKKAQMNVPQHKQPSPRQSTQQSTQQSNQSTNQSFSQNQQEEFKQQQQQQQQLQQNKNKLPPSNLPKKQQSEGVKPTAQQNISMEKENKDNNGNNEDDEEILPPSPHRLKVDVRCMKETLKMDKVSAEFFDFHDKVNTVLEEQEEIFATHMAAIKEDAKLLTQESELISNVQGVGFMDYDIDLYVKKLESVIKKKLKMYNFLSKKLVVFKKHLQEEEEISKQVKDTFYF